VETLGWVDKEVHIATLFLIFNHRVTPLQEEDARRSLGVDRIVEPPEDLKGLWQQVPAEPEIIDGYLAPIKEWLRDHAQKGDYVLIQGDFGACFIMVNFAMGQGLIPIYSTTEREAAEEHRENGTVKIVHYFQHRRFRRYGI
jgi:hypothetical protein